MKSVAIQGIKGAFHEEAAVRFFDEDLDIVPCMRFSELVSKVSTSDCDFGVIAVENTVSGTINQNLKLISDDGVSIVGEISMRIVQNLGALPGQEISALKEVMSHYMALHQCRRFFASNPHIRLVEVADTALAAKMIRDDNLTGVGAVASQRAMEHYDLETLAPGIETNHTNHTRFFIIRSTAKAQSDITSDKCTLHLILPSQPGSLYRVLGIFANAGINLTKIESIPIEDQPYHYAFIVDCVFGSIDRFRQIVPHLKEQTEQFKVLGFYKSSNSVA